MNNLKRVIFLLITTTFLFGCDASPMAKAKQNFVCKDAGGVYERYYLSELVLCRNGELRKWNNVTLTEEFYPDTLEEIGDATDKSN